MHNYTLGYGLEVGTPDYVFNTQPCEASGGTVLVDGVGGKGTLNVRAKECFGSRARRDGAAARVG